MRDFLSVLIAAMIFAVPAVPAQQKACNFPEMKVTPQNLSFSEGVVGSTPIGWILGQSSTQPAAYEALVVEGKQCDLNGRCGTVHSLDPPGTLAFLYQDIEATPYRGQTLTFRALVRVDQAFHGIGRLLVRVHRRDCSTAFFDNLGDHPVISGEWAVYQIRAPISEDAYHIEFGVQLVGNGALWIDQISTEFKPGPTN